MCIGPFSVCLIQYVLEPDEGVGVAGPKNGGARTQKINEFLSAIYIDEC